jgi:hypothetical protein
MSSARSTCNHAPGRLVPPRTAVPAAGDVHPHRRGAAHVRRAGPGLQTAVLPVPGRKRWQELLGFVRQVRSRFPSGQLFVVCDNFSPHHKQQVRDWCTDHDVELVFTPSNASWLNWIECEFTALRYFTLESSDYPSHAAQEAAIAGYVRWGNRRARPK